MTMSFKAKIYKTGINACADVPGKITSKMTPTNGRIKITGTINDFAFTKTLMPVKNKPYRLFVNQAMLKGAQTVIGKTALFSIKQNFNIIRKEYPIPEVLIKQLREENLFSKFNDLTNSKKNEILKYLSYVKTEKTMQKNINTLIKKLEKGKDVRLP